MRYKILVTCITDNDGAIAKKISWDGTKLIKSAQVSVKNGWMEAIEFETWEEFKDYLNRMSSNECLVLGHFLHGVNARLVGSKEAQDVLRNAFNRSLENFDWHELFQLLCLDYDGVKAGDLTPDEVIAIIDNVMPRFAAVKKVVKYSSSAHIYDEDGNLLSSSNGFHIYFMVNHPELIAEFFASKSAWLHKKLWLAGHGYIKNSRPKDRSTTAVTQMVRTIYDYAVFSPERIIFETAPVLGDGNSICLASYGASVLCVDNNKEALEHIDSLAIEIQSHSPKARLSTLNLDLINAIWPFEKESLGAIINVHFFLPNLLDCFLYSLEIGGYLCIETIDGHGGNYLQLPQYGFVKAKLADMFEIIYYAEKKVGPPESDAATLKIIARKTIPWVLKTI